MTKQQVIQACIEIVETMRAQYVPRDTGNMAFNGLRYEVTADGLEIGIVGDIAPYAPYTEYPWVSTKWRGKKNPNEGWWERFREEFSRRLAARLGGKITYA